MKDTAIFTCKKCGAQFPKWMGRCTECGAWGTVGEEMDPQFATRAREHENAPPAKASSFTSLEAERKAAAHQLSGIPIWDNLLGGFVPGSVTLFAGEPGIGKSTLLSQLALALATKDKKVFYVTGEESPSQVLMRLERLAGGQPHANLYFIDNTDARTVAATIAAERPSLAIVDSIQTLSVPGVSGEIGSPGQVKAAAATIAAGAKAGNIPVILAGQVTKEGDVAGPRQLEHLVDTVLMLEGDRTQMFRYLRVLKHRFGETGDSALLRMTARGLEEVLDPSSALVADRPSNVSGSAITCVMDGRRALLVELQALVTPAGYGTPLRRVSGLDANRISLLLAVMARRGGVSFSDQDVFMNVVGGLKFQEPAADLAAVLALASAKSDVPLPEGLLVVGEVGLAGELRMIPRLDDRLKEAKRLGFTQAVIPKQKNLPESAQLDIKAFSTIKDAMEAFGLRK